MRTPVVALSASLFALAWDPARGAADSKWFEGVGILPGANFSDTRDITPDGSTVIGNSGSFTSGWSSVYRWTRSGGIQSLGLPNSATRDETSGGVSDNGKVVVGNASVPHHDHTDLSAARWTEAGGWTVVPQYLGQRSAQFQDCSADGNTAVGQAAIGGFDRAMIWTAAGGKRELFPGVFGATFALKLSADGKAVMGPGPGGMGVHHLDTGVSELMQLPDGAESFSPYDLARDGKTAVGRLALTRDQAVPFRWTAQTGIRQLQMLDAHGQGSCQAVSGDGSVAGGWCEDGAGVGQPVLWMSDGDVVPLVDLLGDTVPSGWRLTQIYALSLDGTTVVGAGLHDGIAEGFVAHVPSPGCALFAIGMGWSMGRRRRG